MPFGQYGTLFFWWADGYGYGTNGTIRTVRHVGRALLGVLRLSAGPPITPMTRKATFVGNVDRE